MFLLFCCFCCVFLFCPSFVANSQQDDGSICDGPTDVRLVFWNVLKRNIPGLLSCFQAVSSYLRLCYSAGAQKARRPHEKQIGLYWLFWDMFGALNPFRPSVYQTFWNQCEHKWCLHSTCRFLVRNVSQITTANRPMFCRKPSHLKGDWDMFSIVISSYIFLNQTWTKCE